MCVCVCVCVCVYIYIYIYIYIHTHTHTGMCVCVCVCVCLVWFGGVGGIQPHYTVWGRGKGVPLYSSVSDVHSASLHS